MEVGSPSVLEGPASRPTSDLRLAFGAYPYGNLVELLSNDNIDEEL